MSPTDPVQRIPVSEALRAVEPRLHALMAASQGGDPLAYRALLQAVAPHLRGFLRRRMQQWPDEVEDIVQECLLALHNQRHTWDAGLPVTSWIQAIARYKLIDWLRRHGRRDARHVEYDDAAGFAGEDGAGTQAARDASHDLAGLLVLLPPQQQAAIVHTKLDGWSVRETAQALRISEASVKTAVHRGLKALAEKLRTMT